MIGLFLHLTLRFPFRSEQATLPWFYVGTEGIKEVAKETGKSIFKTYKVNTTDKQRLGQLQLGRKKIRRKLRHALARIGVLPSLPFYSAYNYQKKDIRGRKKQTLKRRLRNTFGRTTAQRSAQFVKALGPPPDGHDKAYCTKTAVLCDVVKIYFCSL